ncbi:MAG: hypothetical protein FWE72_07075, partial [Spirochaetaceae bacterium]|nr:hypothetical protein [Spirochaetaceae bacterium]
HYTKLIMEEMAKYPDEYFKTIDLEVIVIVKNLKFDNVYRASVPDNYKRILFMGIRSDYRDDYLRHVYHHEKNHYAEFYIWKNYRYDWPEWRKLYESTKRGGETAYQNGEDRSVGVYRKDLVGFLNTYSTLGQEEDRSEMIAYFLTDSENKLFMEKAKNDKIFYQKAVLLFTLYKEKLNFDLLKLFLSKANG